MKKRSQRLQVIVDLKASQEKKYLEKLGIEQMKQRQKEQQLDNFKAYQKDYAKRHAHIMRAGVSVMQLLEFRVFMDKMNKAIDGEEQVLKNIESSINQLRKDWEASHIHTKKIKQIQKESLLVERRLDEKKEQMEMDERSSTMAARYAVNGIL